MKIRMDIGYKKKVLYRDVEFEIPEQGIISFIGENGSGKSTIYKTLLQKIPALKGKVPDVLYKKGAIVSDQINAPAEVRVKDILALFDSRKLKEANEQFPKISSFIEKLRFQKIGRLSSGQKRIVEIFSVLASGKTYIFLDEATNSLDFQNKELVISQVKELSQQGIVFFYTTHDFSELNELGGTLYLLFKNKQEIVKFPENEKRSVERIQQSLRKESVRL